MMEYLDLGGLRVHDANASVPFLLTRAQGLTGLSGARGEAYDRPEADGAVEPLAQFYPARVITLEGECWSSLVGAPYRQVVADAWSHWDDLAAVLDGALSTDTALLWKRLGGTVDLQGTVRLAGEVTPIFDDTGAPVISFQAQLRASDPRWYSATQHSAQTSAPSSSGGLALPLAFPLGFGNPLGGSLSIANAGNTKTWPRVTIAGPINSPVIENTSKGAAVYFDGLVLGASDLLTVEMTPAGRFATVNGVNALPYLRWIGSSFFSIAARATESVRFYGLTGGYATSTQMTVAWRDAYTT
jgi:hypothetical protein